MHKLDEAFKNDTQAKAQLQTQLKKTGSIYYKTYCYSLSKSSYQVLELLLYTVRLFETLDNNTVIIQQ